MDERISEDTLREKRLLYIELSTLGIRIIFPGRENATREFPLDIPDKKIILRFFLLL